VVDDFLGEFDLATRPLDVRLGRVSDLAAMALLPDGMPVVLLDVDDLMRSALHRERAHLQHTSGPAARRRKRVLVADDSISVRELERQLLVARGFEVEVAVDGMDAWTRLRDEAFDLLVTDVDMPRMDGIELTRSIKQDARLRSLPVIIVSYRDRPEDRRRGMDARADSYLTKSDFQDESFVRLVHQLVGDAEESA
jgi:two-component system sensor histidine kinase and response regulator WspE